MLLSEGERSKNPGTSFYFAALGNVKPPQPEPERIAAHLGIPVRIVDNLVLEGLVRIAAATAGGAA